MASQNDDVLTLNERKTVLPHAEVKGAEVTLKSSERDRLEELDELGRGGMGEVVMAMDHDIARTVAVKRLDRNADAQLIYRFLEEVRTLGQLEHPNIVPLYDVGLDSKGRYFFVMKKLEGLSLDRIIDGLAKGDASMHERFPFQVRVQICLGMLNALMHAHRLGIIHRDLKPANIIVGSDGEVTVLDWGIAKRVKTAEPVAQSNMSLSGTSLDQLQTTDDVVIGTPQYMSPEQARGEEVDARSDLYSLGVVFHELLYLDHYLSKVPRKSRQVVLRAVNELIPRVHVMRPHPTQPMVPMELSWFCNRAFQKDPAKRFQSADEMHAALINLMDGCFAVKCPRTAIKRAMRASMPWVDAHPYLSVAAVSSMALLMIAGVANVVRLML